MAPVYAGVVLDLSALEEDEDILWQCLSATGPEVLSLSSLAP
jgi:hypothetical protein